MITAVGTGEPQAAPRFETVFHEHAPYVWRAIRYLGIPSADVRDVAQEVFVVVHKRLADFRPGAPVRPWLYGICVKVALAHRRRAHVRREQVVDELPTTSVPPSQEVAVERLQVRERLQAALDQLDDDKRLVFVLHEIEDLPMREIAEIAGCPIQTGYSRLRAAKAALVLAYQRLDSGAAP